VGIGVGKESYGDVVCGGRRARATEVQKAGEAEVELLLDASCVKLVDNAYHARLFVSQPHAQICFVGHFSYQKGCFLLFPLVRVLFSNLFGVLFAEICFPLLGEIFVGTKISFKSL
jgi:hypothetical protein